jgi:hypothetical protein
MIHGVFPINERQQNCRRPGDAMITAVRQATATRLPRIVTTPDDSAALGLARQQPQPFGGCSQEIDIGDVDS